MIADITVLGYHDIQYPIGASVVNTKSHSLGIPHAIHEYEKLRKYT